MTDTSNAMLVGITDPSAGDLWTALLAGRTNQQVSNDPSGDRWARLNDEAVDMFLAHVGRGSGSAR